MAEYIDREKLYKSEIARCRCVPLVGSCTNDNKSLRDVLNEAPTEDVVPRSEVELDEIAYKSLKELYDNDVKELSDNNEKLRAEVEFWKNIAEANHKQLENAYEKKQKAIVQAKQEVAKQIFEEIEKFIESDKGKVIYEANGKDWFENAKTFEISHNIGVGNAKNALRDLLDELKKKYIGE